MNRRGFLAAMLALGAAPAIVRASSLMPIRPLVCYRQTEWDFSGAKPIWSREVWREAVDQAYLAKHSIKPVSINGEDCYVVMVHPGSTIIVPANRHRAPILPYMQLRVGNRCV